MIVFDLSCSCGCQFEGWFGGRDDFEEQLRKGILQCPACGGFEVHKILSPVTVQKSSSGSWATEPQTNPQSVSGADHALKILQAVSRLVRINFEDVGTRLAEESLRMHYGIEKSRNIRGVATEEEERMLREEGIELLKVPILPEGEKENSN